MTLKELKKLIGLIDEIESVSMEMNLPAEYVMRETKLRLQRIARDMQRNGMKLMHITQDIQP
jgi:FKBP-type peptidyl-prolyl cis-trans isomerase (trigger factor)